MYSWVVLIRTMKMEAGLWDDGEYVDERTGEELDPKLVRQAEVRRSFS